MPRPSQTVSLARAVVADLEIEGNCYEVSGIANKLRLLGRENTALRPIEQYSSEKIPCTGRIKRSPRECLIHVTERQTSERSYTRVLIQLAPSTHYPGVRCSYGIMTMISHDP